MKTLTLLSFITIGLTGCISAPTPDELAKADYGAYPINYEVIIEGYMQEHLKDPESARFKFLEKPKPDWGMVGDGVVGQRAYGYGACTYVNAKNGYGGYVGNKIYYFLIREGSVIRSDNEWPAGEKCKDVMARS